MANRRSFKTDESFLEKLAIGAIGTRAVFGDLTKQGHRPIELERGSMNYKIWKNIKIKRLRVPDILCLNCAIRVEARAKTQLEISMSHSAADPERGWDRGLTNNDVVGLSICKRIGEAPTDWQATPVLQYIHVSSLKKAYTQKQVIEERPKGAQEGFELRITWPSAVASAAGTVIDVTPSRFKFRRKTDDRTISLSLQKKGIPLRPLVRPGETIVEGQIVASVIPVASVFICPANAAASNFLDMISSTSVADRYSAVKALSYFADKKVSKALNERMSDANEHIYVRLESAAGLARLGQVAGMDFIKTTLHDEYLEHRLEAVIILGELHTKSSEDLLINVLSDKEQNPEIRAGAAWALGELQRTSSVEALVKSFLELAGPVRIEAARALRKIASTTKADIISKLPAAQDDQRAGIAWAAGKAGNVEIEDLLKVMADDNARRWVAYIIGTQDEKKYIGKIEALRRHDPEVYFAVTVLWQILTSWVNNLEEY